MVETKLERKKKEKKGDVARYSNIEKKVGRNKGNQRDGETGGVNEQAVLFFFLASLFESL